MKPIYRDTIARIDKSIKKLSPNELKEAIEGMKVRQPFLFDFIWKLTDELSTKENIVHLNYLFLFSVRCYEFCYGHLNEINQISINVLLKKWKNVIEQSLKHDNPAQMVNELNRINNQPDMADYLTEYLLGLNESAFAIRNNASTLIKIKFLFVFNMLNVQVKKNYPEPIE
jgi:hypothetical protein